MLERKKGADQGYVKHALEESNPKETAQRKILEFPAPTLPSFPAQEASRVEKRTT